MLGVLSLKEKKDVRCIVKWVSKIDIVVFEDVK